MSVQHDAARERLLSGLNGIKGSLKEYGARSIQLSEPHVTGSEKALTRIHSMLGLEQVTACTEVITRGHIPIQQSPLV